MRKRWVLIAVPLALAAIAGAHASFGPRLSPGAAVPTYEVRRVAFVRRVIDTKGFVQESDLAAVKQAGYTDGQIAETVGYIALATYSNFFNHVYDTPLDFPQVPKV